MNKMVALLVSVPLVLGPAGSAMAQTAANVEVESDPVATPAGGEWQYVDGMGWVWVPAGTVAYDVDSSPYVYLYTPVFGWNWYVSPWGWGPYYRGGWIHSPYWGHGPSWGRAGVAHHGAGDGGRAVYGRGYHSGHAGGARSGARYRAGHTGAGHPGGGHAGGGHGGHR